MTPHSTEPTNTERWRTFARRFRAVNTMVACKRLPAEFEPEDLEKLIEWPQLADSWRGILQFLLHLQNPHHYHFNLGEIRRWDCHHLPVFIAWVNGEAGNSHPCRYF